MGWFNDQIQERAENDQSMLEDSFFALARVVMDRWTANRLEDRPRTVRLRQCQRRLPNAPGLRQRR